MRTAEQLVSAEVHYCVSLLVSTLAGGYGCTPGRTAEHATLGDLCEQALDLAAPIPDYEEAAIQAGWEKTPSSFLQEGSKAVHFLPDWQSLCRAEDIEPYDREVFEHWIVSDWLAEKLAAKGEKVDTDFAGLTIWARTTTGQSIAMDSVIQEIHADLVREYGE